MDPMGNLVDGFNPFEKYWSKWVHLPQVGMKHIGQNGNLRYLEDHPRTCKWLISMVHGDCKSPKDRVVPLPNGLFMACKWGVILTTY